MVYDEEYKSYRVVIHSKFIKDYYDFYEKLTNAVRLDYEVYDPTGNFLELERYQFTVIPQQKAKRFLFWEFQPKTTFKEDVEDELKALIEFIKGKIDKRLFEKEVTEGLMDSLKQFN